MLNFTAIDFETADQYMPCSLGLAVVADGKIIETKYWLIKPLCYPYFHFYAQKVHGIKKADVKTKPYFNELWDEIKPYIENQNIVAHNAAFDISVLKKTLQHYNIVIPKFTSFCSFQTAKKVWTEDTKGSLDYLCEKLEIDLEHHNAMSDAIGCAKVFLKEMELLNITDLKQYSTIRKQLKQEEKERKERKRLKELEKQERRELYLQDEALRLQDGLSQ